MPAHITARRRLIAGVVALAVLIVTPLAVVAADKFTDVPNSNVFHDNITWLADAGVTKGCNPPANTQFCPSDNVTREQMAAFMQRLAENKVVDAATAVTAETAEDADTLDGADGTAYRSIVVANATGSSIALSGLTGTSLAEVSLSVGTSGSAMISATASPLAFGNVDTSPLVAMWVQVDNTTCANAPGDITPPAERLVGAFTAMELDGDINVAPMTVSAGANVSSGNHTFTLCAAMGASTESASVLESSIVASFSPGGSVSVAGGLASGTGVGSDG